MELYRNNNPVVSVIMPTFNRAAYLERSIQSFLNQTYKNAELIIIDDGSTDHTFDIINPWIQKHEFIRYIKHSNRRPSLSRNAGIQLACGEYIAFLDSDDEYQSDYLEIRVHFLRNHPEYDLIESDVTVIGNPYVKDKHDLSKLIHLSQCHIGATFIGKASVFHTLGGFNKDIYYSEDGDFWERAEKHFNTTKIQDKGYVYYRDSPHSISSEIMSKS